MNLVENNKKVCTANINVTTTGTVNEFARIRDILNKTMIFSFRGGKSVAPMSFCEASVAVELCVSDYC